MNGCIRPIVTPATANHTSNTDAGKLCRLLLTKFTSICEAEDYYDGEPLNITEVIVEVVEPPSQPVVRTFRNIFTERRERESVGPTNPNFCSTFVEVQSNMEGNELESLEDRSDIIKEVALVFVNNDVIEISVENSVEITAVNNNSEVSVENTETDVVEEVPPVTDFVEISVNE